jgi:hypothetical protein
MAAPKGHPPYPGCETGGRPVEWTPERIEAEADALVEWLKITTNIWFKRFCMERDIPADYMSIFARKNAKFHRAYKKAIITQEARLVEGGLYSITNPTMSIFVLKCNHKWVEGTDATGMEEKQSASSKALDNITGAAIEYANSLKQASDQSSDV